MISVDKCKHGFSVSFELSGLSLNYDLILWVLFVDDGLCGSFREIVLNE